jgi:hypothetical protein
MERNSGGDRTLLDGFFAGMQGALYGWQWKSGRFRMK